MKGQMANQINGGKAFGAAYIMDGQDSLFGHRDIVGFGTSSFKIGKIERGRANEIIVKNHYSHKFYAATYIHLGLFLAGELVGVLQYGYAMNPASMASVVAETKLDEYLELNRMWLDDKAPRNSESRAIAYSIKYIKRVYPKIKWVQSFADERCNCLGVVYQAANFEYYGDHRCEFWELDGVIYHHSLMERDRSLSKAAARLQDGKDRATSSVFRQFRYLYFIDKRSRKLCRLKKQEYPKRSAQQA